MKTYEANQKTVEALQWTGDNKDEVKAFIKSKINFVFGSNEVLHISTIKGKKSLLVYDYLIKKNDGTFTEMEEDYFEEFFTEI